MKNLQFIGHLTKICLLIISVHTSLITSQLITYDGSNYFLCFIGSQGTVNLYDASLNLKQSTTLQSVSASNYYQRFYVVNYNASDVHFILLAGSGYAITISPSIPSILLTQSLSTVSASAVSRYWNYPYVSYSVPGTSYSTTSIWCTGMFVGATPGDIAINPQSNQLYIYSICSCASSASPTVTVQDIYGNQFTCNSNYILSTGYFSTSSDVNCLISVDQKNLCYLCNPGYVVFNGVCSVESTVTVTVTAANSNSICTLSTTVTTTTTQTQFVTGTTLFTSFVLSTTIVPVISTLLFTETKTSLVTSVVPFTNTVTTTSSGQTFLSTQYTTLTVTSTSISTTLTLQTTLVSSTLVLLGTSTYTQPAITTTVEIKSTATVRSTTTVTSTFVDSNSSSENDTARESSGSSNNGIEIASLVLQTVMFIFILIASLFTFLYCHKRGNSLSMTAIAS